MERNLIIVCIILLLEVSLACSFRDEVPPPCNPRTDSECIAQNQALLGSISANFGSEVDGFKAATCPENILYSDGLQLSINQRFDNPSIMSDFYILYGKAEATIKAAAGVGIISSFYLQSDDLDEIDVAEIFGGNIFEYQSNYFVKGNTTTYDRGGYHAVPVSPMEHYIRYGVEWTAQSIIWTVNGNPIRVLRKDETAQFPSSPMIVKFSIWAGGDKDNAIGTIQWAGGTTQYDSFPYTMLVQEVYVENYSTGKYYYYGNGWQGVSTEKPPTKNKELQSYVPNESKEGKKGGKKGVLVPPDKRFYQFNDSHLECKNVAAKPAMRLVTVFLLLLVLAM